MAETKISAFPNSLITPDNADLIPIVDVSAGETKKITWANLVAAIGGGTVTSVSGTANRITSTGGATPVIDISASYVGQASITTLGTITTGTWNATAITEVRGGTNQTTYALGDLLYASAANTLSKLAGNITATKKFLSQTGNGAISAAPTWEVVTKTDVGLSNVENTALSTWIGSANISDVGLITSGTWEGGVIAPAFGGTGIANSRTITILSSNAVFDFIDGAIVTVTNHASIEGTNTGDQTLASLGISNYEDHPLADYAGTDTWNGTPPNTLVSKKFAWLRIDGLVTLTLAIVYSVAGATNTSVSFTLPAGCPTPATIAGLGDDASEVMYSGMGRMEASVTSLPGTARCFLSKNAANDGYIITVLSGSSAAKVASFTIQYRVS